MFVQREEDYPDIFAEQPMIGAERPDDPNHYWVWRLVDHRDGRPGRLEVEANGERQELSAGRFAMDELRSITAYKPGFIDVVSAGSGWYRVPMENWEMKEFQRVDVPVDHARVSDLHLTLIDDLPELCLDIGSGEKRVISAQGEIRGGVSSCPEYLGRDEFWNYTRTEHGIRIHAEDVFGRAGERSLDGGRFGDDVAVWFPAVLADQGDIHYQIPTRDGIVDLRADLERQSFYFDVGGKRPTLLYTDPNNRLFSLDRHRLLPVHPESGIEPILLQGIPEAVVPSNVVDGPDDSLRVEWSDRLSDQGSDQGRPHWAYFDRSGAHRATDRLWTLLQDNRYQFQQGVWRETPLRDLELDFGPGMPTLYVNRRVRVSLGPDKLLQRRAQAIVGKSLFVLEPHELWEIRLDASIRRAVLAGQNLPEIEEQAERKTAKEHGQPDSETEQAVETPRVDPPAMQLGSTPESSLTSDSIPLDFLQQALKDLGLYRGLVDHRMRPLTRQAIRNKPAI